MSKIKDKGNYQKNDKFKLREDTKIKIGYAIFSSVVGLFIGIFIMSIFGYSPFPFFNALFVSNFGSGENFANFISTLTWMAFIGLALMVSFRAGVFNIGASAQMVGGGLAGYLFAALVTNMGRYGVIFTILIPIAFGLMIGMLIAFLKNRFGIHEVVSSIMLNWAIYWTYRYFMNPSNAAYLFPNGATTPISITNDNSLRFAFAPNSPLNIGIIILIIAVPLIWFLYRYTTFGFKQSIIKNSKDVALYTGINYDKELYKAFALSGGLAGLAGGCFYLGTNQSLLSLTSDLPVEAFNGITISLIGFNDPLGVFIAAIFLSMFENGKNYFDVTADSDISVIIMSLILWLLSISNYFLIVKPQNKLFNWTNYKNISDDDNFDQSDSLGGQFKKEDIEKKDYAMNQKNLSQQQKYDSTRRLE